MSENRMDQLIRQVIRTNQYTKVANLCRLEHRKSSTGLKRVNRNDAFLGRGVNHLLVFICGICEHHRAEGCPASRAPPVVASRDDDDTFLLRMRAALRQQDFGDKGLRE